jgi:type III secretion protein T
MQDLSPIVRQYADFLVALVMTMPRIFAFMDSSQLLSSSAIPNMSRRAVMVAIALLIFPINISYAHNSNWSITSFILLLAREYMIGVILGFFVAWIFWVVQTAGSFIDNQRGASIASSIDPLMGAESSPLGDMFSLMFLTYIFATGSALQVLGLLFKSYQIWPISREWPVLTPGFPVLALGVFDYTMQLAFDFAAPVIAVMFLAEFALAMVSRFAPQVQVFILAMPIKSMLAVFMLIFYSAVLFPYANSRIASTWTFVSRFYSLLGAAGGNDPTISTTSGRGGSP